MGNIIGQIEAHRILQGMSIRDICRFAEITPRFYRMVLSGQSDISLRITAKLAEKTGFYLILGVK